MAEFDPKDPAFKQAMKEGLSEWLDEQYAKAGKWAVNGLLAAAFAGLIYLAIVGMGWSKN